METDIRSGIAATAAALGMDPLDLATIISYETGGTFNPSQPGPTTKWGQHRGLIQFGEPQAKQYGVDWVDPMGSQLGPNGAIVKYFQGSGWKPGMGLLDAYSIVNAGGPGRYNASDTAAGGAPGTVRDKVEKQMGGHRQKASALFGKGSGGAVQHPPNPAVTSDGQPAVYPQASPPQMGIPVPTAPKPQQSPFAKAMEGLGGGLGDMGMGSAAAPLQTNQTAAAPSMQMPMQATVNPDIANAQRDQLAQALVRLNSGRLYG
jgi:hypothetical protein